MHYHVVIIVTSIVSLYRRSQSSDIINYSRNLSTTFKGKRVSADITGKESSCINYRRHSVSWFAPYRRKPSTYLHAGTVTQYICTRRSCTFQQQEINPYVPMKDYLRVYA